MAPSLSPSAEKLVQIMLMPHVAMGISFATRTSFYGYKAYANNVLQSKDSAGVIRNDFLRGIISWQKNGDGPTLQNLFSHTTPDFFEEYFQEVEDTTLHRTIAVTAVHDGLLKLVTDIICGAWMEFGTNTASKMQRWCQFLIEKEIIAEPNPIDITNPEYQALGRAELINFDVRSLYIVISQVVYLRCEIYQPENYRSHTSWETRSAMHIKELFPTIVALNDHDSGREVEVAPIGSFSNIHDLGSNRKNVLDIHKYHLALCKSARKRMVQVGRMAQAGNTQYNRDINGCMVDQLKYVEQEIQGNLSRRVINCEKQRRKYRRDYENSMGPKDPSDSEFDDDMYLTGGYELTGNFPVEVDVHL